MLEYYRRLWKNNKKRFIPIFILFMIGITPIIYDIINIDKINESSGVSTATVHNSPLLIPFTATNGGMIVIGLIIIYTALIFLPRNIPVAQNPDDYTVKIDDENIYIKFKKYEFELKNKNFSPTILLFRDKNHKFITVTTGYQIYNYVNYYYRDKINK